MSASARLYVVVGEPSGDLHAAGLLAHLVGKFPDLEVRGVGGPRMQEVVGDRIRDWVDDAAVMGVWEVLKRYGWFRSQFRRMLDEVERFRPDILLCVDYPGFNLRFAAAVRRRWPQVRLVHYICPQVWAWHKERIPKMARLLDEVLCLFPFEPKLFAGTALKATFVGHPMVDELSSELRAAVDRRDDLVGLFPGSRAREVASLFPAMLEAACQLRVERPGLRFAVPAASPTLAAEIRLIVDGAHAGEWIEVRDGGSHRLMREAVCGVVASGTATLEAACLGLPYGLVYRVAPLTYWLARLLVNIPHIGLVNILAGREVVTELIQHRASAVEIAALLRRLLDTPLARQQLQRQLAETAGLLGEGGAHQRAADAVSRWFPTSSC